MPPPVLFDGLLTAPTPSRRLARRRGPRSRAVDRSSPRRHFAHMATNDAPCAATFARPHARVAIGATIERSATSTSSRARGRWMATSAQLGARAILPAHGSGTRTNPDPCASRSCALVPSRPSGPVNTSSSAINRSENRNVRRERGAPASERDDLRSEPTRTACKPRAASGELHPPIH